MQIETRRLERAFLDMLDRTDSPVISEYSKYVDSNAYPCHIGTYRGILSECYALFLFNLSFLLEKPVCKESIVSEIKKHMSEPAMHELSDYIQTSAYGDKILYHFADLLLSNRIES